MTAFVQPHRPLLVAMAAAQAPEDAIAKILAPHYNGAEAFYVQLELPHREYRNRHMLQTVISYCRAKPVIVTACRFGHTAHCSDNERAQLLETREIAAE